MPQSTNDTKPRLFVYIFVFVSISLKGYTFLKYFYTKDVDKKTWANHL